MEASKQETRGGRERSFAAATIQIYFIRHLVLATWLDASPGRLTAELDLGRDDSSTQDTQDVAARDLPYVGLRKADIQEGLSYGDDLARVKARSGRTVEVRAEPNVINSDEIADMGNGSRRVLGISGADPPFQ